MDVNSMSYAKYDSYKDSGVDWLGEIPSDWDLVPLRAIFRFRNEKNNPVITENILSLSIAKGVTGYDDENRGGNKRKDDITAYKIARPNDIVLNSMNVIVGAVGVSKYFGAISPVYYALYAFNDLGYVPYFNWIFQNTGFQKGLLKYGKGILIKLGEEGKMNTIRMKISQDDLKVLQFPLPNFEKQTKIANFLDEKTAQIDQAIALKQQQIEKLNEYKQIVIQNAVTKGLNPNAPMKDSGVEWIGDIPEHWQIVSIKRIARISPRIDLSNYKLDEKVTFLPMEKVSSNGDIDCEILKPIREVKQGFTAFKKNDVIIAKITPCFENGKGALLDKLETEIGYGSTEFHVLRAGKRVKAYYLYLITHSSKFLTLGEAMMTGSAGQKRVPTDFVANYQFPLPPISEQKEVIAYVEKLNKKISDTIQSYQTQIDRLKEYKNILINQAVTGKIKIA